MYNVFTDFHHASLLNSFILLFEKRLKGNVYRPIGIEWWEKGFWKLYDHPATVQQFLGINAATPDGTPPVNDVEGWIGDGRRSDFIGKNVYLCHDIDSGQTNKAIMFDAFMQMKIDIVIASIPQHVEPFRKLCELHPSHPKLIYQIGNAWNIPPGVQVKNVMASAIIHDPIPPGINFVSYHQEFDLDIFKPNITVSKGEYFAVDPTITSFVNCFGIDKLFENDWQLFEKVEKMMPSWTFKSYGGQCRDGSIGPSEKLAEAMRMSRFIWHTKNGGDGYGHILHNAAAVGRPMIAKVGYYMGKMGWDFMKDGINCVGIDGLSPDEIVKKIEYYSEPTRYQELCTRLQQDFREKVDFDYEFTLLQKFFEHLL